MTKMERIRALIGNLKNWDWTVHPQFPVEKEDAEALQDIDAIKEYIKEREKYGKGVHNRQEEDSTGEEGGREAKEGGEEQDHGDIEAP